MFLRLNRMFFGIDLEAMSMTSSITWQMEIFSGRPLVPFCKDEHLSYGSLARSLIFSRVSR